MANNIFDLADLEVIENLVVEAKNKDIKTYTTAERNNTIREYSDILAKIKRTQTILENQ